MSGYTKNDFESDQEVRWCPGCGDYAVLASLQRLLPTLNRSPDSFAFVSGIGCSSRLPYYMETYGFHTIHGRAPTIATGLKLANPDLSVWVITGDGDGLSICANHLLHIMRRNVDVTILLFNNRIYGLTKGQYSPTSEAGKVTKTSPEGAQEKPVDPVRFALAAGCSFVARAIDVDASRLQAVLKAAEAHKGTSFVEIYQNCNVFNDGAFTTFADRQVRAERTLTLTPGEPLLFGTDDDKALVFRDNTWVVVPANERLETDIYNPNDLAQKTALSHLSPADNMPVPIGIFCEEEKACYCLPTSKPPSLDKCSELLKKGDTWQV